MNEVFRGTLKPLSIKHWGKSIVASKPNEYWHADVTQFRTGDGTLHYIYLVVDNFSKMILSYAVDTRLSAAIRTQTFKEALAKAIAVNPTIETINLIVDGGSENNNQTVDEFIASLQTIKISKIRALKDVRFSPSSGGMAEAANRILKTYYLNRRNIFNTSDLERSTEKAIYDFTEVRPHGQLEGLIPIQAYTGVTIDKAGIDQQKAIARKNRTEINRKSACSSCKF